MIRPAAFGFNPETAANNFFQSDPGEDQQLLQSQALAEFDAMVQKLRQKGIEVIVIDDTPDPPKPDALFPNNWLSTSPNGTVFVFPMYAPSRRAEKREEVLLYLKKHFKVADVQDWSEFETEGKFLEGTGSMVIDHDNKMIYAAVSERTSIALLEKFAATNGYQAIAFVATDNEGRPIYHTNVMMCLGDRFAILCEEAIEEEWELIAVRQLLESTGHEIIPISREQMSCFGGNMLLLRNEKGENLIVMSEAAFQSLRKEQVEMLEAYGEILSIAVSTIERVEGGSVRCMMAELFLQKK
jgi:hypothetical protein